MKLADPADKIAGTDQFTPVHHSGKDVRSAHGWTVEQWISYLDRNPHATLPSGVGGMIVGYYRRRNSPCPHCHGPGDDLHSPGGSLVETMKFCHACSASYRIIKD